MRRIAGIVLAALALPAPAHAAQPNAAQRALEQRLGPQAVVDIDAETGTPRVLARLDGTLTGPAAGAPEDVALRYVRANLKALGLTNADLETLEAPVTTTAGGVTEVRWRQAVDGIAAADSELRVHVTGDGRVLNVLGSPVSGLDPDTTPRVSAAEAVRLVGGGDAQLTLFGGRTAWRVAHRASSDAVYDAFVDAETGRVVHKANLVKSVVPADVWRNFPNGARERVDLEPFLNPGATTLSGPWVRAFSDLDDNDAAQPGEEIAPGIHPFTSFAGPGCDATHLCSWDPNTPNSWQANRLQNGVQAFYHANRFAQHLRTAPIGFNGFEAGDRLILQTNDGVANGPDARHSNNANMMTPPEGGSPVMQMFLFRPPNFRPVSGGDDATVVYHEFTHGLSGRLVTDAAGVSALNSAQAGAMGEGWGDWYAKDFIVGEFPALDTATAGEVDMGDYTDLVAHRLRNQALDCPVAGATVQQCPGGLATGPGGFTYGDFARVNGEPQVHGDGEIWAETLWELRGAIGSVAARRLITQGMRLSPPEPSFLDMRNAILQADAAEGGALRAQIWPVFARRGMGFFATTDDADDITPTEDTSVPPVAGAPRGRIAGRVTDAHTGASVAGAKAAIGGLETGPDALSGTSGTDGAYAIEAVPARAYPSVQYRAAGYDQLIRPVTVAANATAGADVTLRRNWASLSGGSSVFGESPFGALGCGPEAALDQRASSGWTTRATSAGVMVITLPGAVDVDRFGIDPTQSCGSESNSATRSFQVETSTTSSGGPWTRALTASMTMSALGKINEFTPSAGATGVRFVRVTLTNNFGGPFRDVSEFAVYGRPTQPPALVDPLPTVVTTAPSIAPQLARPTFTLSRTLRFKVACAADCRVTAKLVVAKAVARRLGLGRSRTAATLTRNLKAGTSTLTLKLNSKASRALRRKVRSFRGTLQISAAYAGEAATSRSRRLTVKR